MKCEVRPDLSIIMPVFNMDKSIDEALSSILRVKREMPVGTVEILIKDGCSTDKTVSVINKYINEIDVFVKAKDDGVAQAINDISTYAKGRFIFFFAADDKIRPKEFISMFNKFKGLNTVDVLVCAASYTEIDAGEKKTILVKAPRAGKYTLADLYFFGDGENQRGRIFPESTIFRRKAIEKLKPLYRNKFELFAYYDMYLRLLKRKQSFFVESTVICERTITSNSTTCKASVEQYNGEWNLVRAGFSLFDRILIDLNKSKYEPSSLKEYIRTKVKPHRISGLRRILKGV